MNVRQSITCGGICLVMAAMGFFLAREGATSSDAVAVTNRVARPTEVKLANRTVKATGFPERFCEHQTASARGTAPYVVTLTDGASKVEAIKAVKACGARVIGPLPPHALLVETSVFALGKMSVDGHFASASEWLPEDKVDPRLKKMLTENFGRGVTRRDSASTGDGRSCSEETRRDSASTGGSGTIDVTVVALAPADIEQLVSLAGAQGGARVKGCLNGKSSVTLKLPREVVLSLVKRGDVRWIEPFARPKLLNDVAVGPTTMNVRTVWNTHGLTGAGQTVTTSDSGIDTGNLETMHADLRNRLAGFKVAHEGYCYDYDANGHGTHTAGSIVGDGTLSDGQICGVAHGAKLWAWFCGGGGDSVYTPDDYDALFRPDGATDACIHSASWGNDTAGAYDSGCHDMDEYVWEHPDFLPVVANGNAGANGSMTVGSPAAAKNVLAVGATENARTEGDGGWGNGDPTKIAGYSSRGPCADGRIKPDLASPGTGVLSTRAYGCSYKYGIFSNTNYAYNSGTSMATPLTAGAAALVREWLVGRRGFTNAPPTAALVKAILTGGAKDVAVPNNNFGWGRTDLGESLSPSNGILRLIDRVPFDNGSERVYTVTLTNEAPFDVQLVWIDYPATAGASAALVNDLDLVVSNRSTGAVWFGNGTPVGDHTNTLESVRIAVAAPGDYDVIVRGYDVSYDSTSGGAAALYQRGAFDAETNLVEEVSERTPRQICVDQLAGDDATATGETDAPYATIAAALAKAVAGDVVRVGPGAYAGELIAPSVLVRIESTDGPSSTILDGGGTNRCYDGSANAETVLSGFTLTNGWIDASYGYGYGAGAYYGTLTNCVIVDCHIIDDGSCNGYGFGGGAAHAELVDCRIENCSAIYAGGGLYDCTAMYCTLVGNEAAYYTSSYGGGGAVSELTHCTVFDNVGGGSGGGVDCESTCTDSIVWGNTLDSGVESNWESIWYHGWVYATRFSWSCTTPTGYSDQGGNTSVAPRWVDAPHGDFRLAIKSPCVGTASDGANMGAWQGEAVVGFQLNATTIGPGTVEPASVFVEEGASATFALSGHHRLVALATNGVSVAVTNEYVWRDVRADGELAATFANTNFHVDAVTGDDASNGWTRAAAKRTIQSAVEIAGDGETVWVWAGVYTGAVEATQAKIDIVGVDGPERTTILGSETNRCYEGFYNPETRLVGFTLEGGNSDNNYGGGVFMGTLSNCVIRNCRAAWGGGGVYKATLDGCVIADCEAGRQGGGAYASTLVNCTVRGCRAGTLRSTPSEYAGGGVDYQCVCTNTILWGNLGPSGGVDNWEVYEYGQYDRRRRWQSYGTYVPYLSWCCTTPYNSVSENCITDDPLFAATDEMADARLYDCSPCLGAGWNGANIGAYPGTGVMKVLPTIDGTTATGEEISNAVASVGYADEAVAPGIGTNAATYAAFQAWSTNGLKSTAVVFSTRAFDSFRVRELVAAPTLLGDGNETAIELTALEPSSDGTCSTTLRLVDGENAIPLCSVKAAYAARTRVGTEPSELAPANEENVATELIDDGRSVKLTITPPQSTLRYFMRFDLP